MRPLLVLEDPDELAADDLALLLGVADAFEGLEEAVGASTTRRLTPVEATKSRSTCSASPLRSRPWSTKTQVSRSPMARWTMRGGHRGVDAAGQRADRAPVADLPRGPPRRLLDDVEHGPRGPAARRVEEVLEHLLAVLGVQHLGVELHAVEAAPGVLEGGDRGLAGRGRHREALGGGGHAVAVGHPHLLRGRQPGEDHTLGQHVQGGAAVLGDARAGRPRRPAPGPSPGSRSRCRTWAPRSRTGRAARPGRPRRRPRRARRTG